MLLTNNLVTWLIMTSCSGLTSMNTSTGRNLLREISTNMYRGFDSQLVLFPTTMTRLSNPLVLQTATVRGRTKMKLREFLEVVVVDNTAYLPFRFSSPSMTTFSMNLFVFAVPGTNIKFKAIRRNCWVYVRVVYCCIAPIRLVEIPSRKYRLHTSARVNFVLLT